ncbi:alanine acetyltransferase [Curtobacterium sp. 'Ferrero']|uniref:GNAT family N-acetyltransferase n=1 Tax=Curtobacterium sp. 'Ferrero' TaxID=2033654 RepID=UPI000BC4B0C6|nr:GNAT family protein [Curtobacterium sp. 'Ferrero']PCN48551.1 alanine acetyltransferase [Curtobacterium sp. 'Ferrero']
MRPTTRLRPIEPGDAPDLAALVTANAEHLRPWEPQRPDSWFTVAGQLDTITQLRAAERRGTGQSFVIDSDGEIVGRITLSGITRGALQSCALGYWVRADRQGRGHATEAVRLAVSHAFDRLGLHRVQAETLPENHRSQRVLERNGFVRYGVAPEYLQIAGQWRDHVMFQVVAPRASATQD